MKHQRTAVFAAICLVMVSLALAACGTGSIQHTHTFSETLSYDETHHWYAATCEHADEVKDKAAHIMQGDACTVCAYTKSTETGATLTEDTEMPVTTLVYGNMRVQLLSTSLLRIESKGQKGFEDRESYLVDNRDDWGKKVAYTKSETAEGVQIKTAAFTVILPKSGAVGETYVTRPTGETIYRYCGLTGSNIALPSPSDELSAWYFTDSPRVIPSEAGYSPTDSALPQQGWDFGNNATDIFVFLPNGSYKTLTSDFVNLTGRTEMVELKTFGQWDSRYYKYDEQTALQQIKDYQDRRYAIDVLVVDTDWREKTGGGIGYDINTELFPDMARFLREAHKLGVNVCFNDHPEPVKGTGNLLDKAEVDYRNEKLTMLLAMGVDNWWYDRNWSVSLNRVVPDYSRYATGMYAYQWITQKHYESIADINEYARRALIMANVDGCNNGSYVYASDLSAHRYAIQWTGDIGAQGNWLQQEIEGAVYAGAELGLPYVSADIGGHNVDPTDEEYARWFQYGALSPILRVHCWNETQKGGRMPWNYGPTAAEAAHTYQDMRYRLLPLYYALAHENYQTGLPIIRRLDIAYPQYIEAGHNDEYLLGDYILVAPLSSWTGTDTREVFLPEGTWIDVWTGARHSGPTTVSVTHGLKTSPIFVREGALIALARNMGNVDEKDWSEMALDVYPSADYAAKTTLYEDDTKTVGYKDGQFRTTDIDMQCDGNALTIRIGAAQGTFGGDRACTDRLWNVRLHRNPTWGDVRSIRVNGATQSAETVAAVTYAEKGRPFAYAGGALDGDIDTLALRTQVDKAYEIVIEYERVGHGEKNAAYDATAIDFRVRAEDCQEKNINLTALGKTDWISFGYSTGTNVDYKKNGARLFTEATDVRLLLDGFAAQYAATPIKGGIAKSYTDGYMKTTNSVTGGTKNGIGYRFGVATTGQKQQIVLYLGGGNTLAKLTVKDRAGNTRTLYLGGYEEKSFVQKVVIEVDPGTASRLQLTYSPVACKVADRGTDSYVALYCGYVA